MRPFPMLALTLAMLAPGCGDHGTEPGGSAPDAAGPAPYAAAETCGACHPQHLAEWKRSLHASAGVDPVMQALSLVAAQEPGESLGDECVQCHAPVQVRHDDILAAGGDPGGGPAGDLLAEGISCDVCHSVTVVPPVADISYLKDVDPRGPKLGGLRDPLPTSAHESLFDNSYQTSINCAPCHQVNLDNGTGVENTYEEWVNSIYGGFPVQCQECHMPKYTGQAAQGGPVREDLHRHVFVGVDYTYSGFRGIDLDAQKNEIRQFLQSAVRAGFPGAVPVVVADGGSFTFSVEVENDRTGHSIPSGTSFSREMWIRIDVRDAGGASVYQSGWLIGPDQDLVSASVDSSLALFQSRMFDASGKRTFFNWRAVSIDESDLIQVGETKVASYTVGVPAGTQGPLTVDATLRFRPMAPEIIRAAGQNQLLPIEIFDMWSGSFQVTVTP